jgi:hypothetical protein
LWGYLEERHAIDEGDIAQVADELQTELSSTNGAVAPLGAPSRNGNGGDPLLAEVLARVSALEQSMTKQERTMRRTIEIIADYVRRSE